ncbi:heterokaryon incompatibility protein-domain-containing protein, partial [Leptodontidium sp. 2 PMI_412]
LVRQWLDECCLTHVACRAARESLPAQDIPCRLIAVGAPGDINICLKELNENSQEVYMALTYCWGGYPTEVTNIDNLPERKRNLSFASLPATIKDAVIVTRELGCKYLWMDALCIRQDHDAERDRGLSKMAQIYSRALLTISAASA